MIKQYDDKNIPELEIHALGGDFHNTYSHLIDKSQILSFSPSLEYWTSTASNKALAYYSHGIFRYFGKFPPPIARYLIKTYTETADLVLDPMCGSGTTAVEALLLNRRAICTDINPLALLISKVKITRINEDTAIESLEKAVETAKAINETKHTPIGLRDYKHWFLEETVSSLSKIRQAIEENVSPLEIKDILFLSFLAVIRRVSRATTQQGRLFLDVTTAEKDAIPFFYKKALRFIKAASIIPENDGLVNVKHGSILGEIKLDSSAKLIICHPPYFNSYRFSRINSLELSWMGVDNSQIRKNEIREAFKAGKPEKVNDYICDMNRALINIKRYLSKDGVLALMIGDTNIKGQYIPVTKMLIESLKDCYKVEHSALRIPQYTEASWAASQRRNGQQVGINMCDFVLILRPQ